VDLEAIGMLGLWFALIFRFLPKEDFLSIFICNTRLGSTELVLYITWI